MAFAPYDPCENFLKPTKVKHEKDISKGRAGKSHDLCSRHKTAMPRRRLNPVSPKRQKENVIYTQEKAIWREERIALDGYLRCEFVETDGSRCARRASPHPHHIKKRGKNLCDRRWFMAVCWTPHHWWIEHNLKEAEARGYVIREYRRI